MGLKKEIELDNGIIVNYHRIVSLNKIINNSNIIEVASYTSEEKREQEKAYYAAENKNDSMNVFINTLYLNVPYNSQMTIEDAYEYLKTTDMFKNAIDLLENTEESET